MRDVNKIGLGLIFAVLVVFGLYELNSNKMPEGLTDQSTIMSKASKGIDTVLGLDMEMNPYDVSYDGDEYSIYYYYKNYSKLTGYDSLFY